MAFNIRSIASRNARPAPTTQDRETAAGYGITSKRGIRNNMENIRGMQGAVSQDWHDQNNGKDFGNTAKPYADKLTAAGKADIALMIPVIFLILPISVLFALWPSYLSLGQSIM